MDVSELNQRLVARGVEAVCRHLLPNGAWKRDGSELRIGNLTGAKGHSLAVHLHGDKAGVWGEFNGGTVKGDLIGLWKNIRCLDIRETLAEVKAYLGIDDSKTRSQKPAKAYKRPPAVDPHRRPAAPDNGAGRSPVFEYLTGERCLSARTVTKFKIDEKTIRGKPFICFRYLNPDGDTLNVKYIGVSRDPEGRKDVLQEPNAEPSLFGWQAMDPNGRTVVLTEGEIDAMSWHEYGFEALSVPNGIGVGAKLDWLEAEAANLDRFKTIFLSFDNETDPKVKKLVDETLEAVAIRLGRHRCPVVRLPRKDANAMLQAGAPQAEMQKALDTAETMDPASVEWAGIYREPSFGRWFGQRPSGLQLPWQPPPGRLPLELLPGQVTILLGIPGHGKTNLTLQLLNHAGAAGFRCCLASPEMPMIEKITMQQRMLIGYKPDDTDDGHEAIHLAQDKIDKFMFHINTGRKLDIKLADLLDNWTYAHARYGCGLFMLDSFMLLDDMEMAEYGAPKKAMQTIAEFAADRQVHVVVVMHPPKDIDSTRIPGMYNICGSSGLVNLTHNGISIWRNFAKEDNEPTKETADAVLHVWKCRSIGKGTAKYKLRYADGPACFEAMDSPSSPAKGETMKSNKEGWIWRPNPNGSGWIEVPIEN